MKKTILKRKNLEILREITETPCYCCSNIGGKPIKRAKCKICKGTGKYKETLGALLVAQYIDGNLKTFTVYGPTCDSLDVVHDAFQLPDKITEGDYIEIGSVGAYSYAIASDFNGFYSDNFEVITE